MNICLVVAFFICTTSIAIMLNYVMSLHEKLEFSNKENVKLLNGMHEGLLILSEKKADAGEREVRSVMFSNRTIQKLFATYIGSLDEVVSDPSS